MVVPIVKYLTSKLLFINYLEIGSSSSVYHPYRSPSAHSSSINRQISVNEAVKTNRILSIESFSIAENIKDTSDILVEYARYMKKHQKSYLRSLFNAHKKENW